MYNILMDSWIPVKRIDGTGGEISPWEITGAGAKNPVMEMTAPRGDLRSGLFHLMLGFLQTMFLPEDEEDWIKYWENPPPTELLREKFASHANAFQLLNPGKPAFMQDLELKEGNDYFENLFIDFSGNGHFNKQPYRSIDPYWGGLGLYTLQQYAPSGGVGHRTGLRGGGPLSTFILPGGGSTLWEQLWMNILPAGQVRGLSGNSGLQGEEHIFPWLRATKNSKNAEAGFYPEEAHPLMMYFGMPRRFRLCFGGKPGICEMSGKQADNLVTGMITENYGNNYSGSWEHPLSPYYLPKKPEDPPNSFKGKIDNIQYRYWLGLSSRDKKIQAAQIVRHARGKGEKRKILKKRGFRLWLNGYDMSNMKARYFSDRLMPSFIFPQDHEVKLLLRVEVFLEASENLASNTRLYILKGLFKDKIQRTWNEIRQSFYRDTEETFFRIISEFRQHYAEAEKMQSLSTQWRRCLVKTSNELFENYVVKSNPVLTAWPGIHAARNKLRAANRNSLKTLDNYINA